MKKAVLFLATGFGSGYIPVMPGTFGTMVGMAIAFAEFHLFENCYIYVNAIVLCVFLIPSIYIAGKAEEYFKKKDASQIVIDEMLGYWLAILFHPLGSKTMILAFVLFRFFDILKPYPINSVQKIRGGIGVIADDLIAGVYVNIILVVLRVQAHLTGVQIL
jgi:phosphatidylglycerophosphatase A